MSRRLSSLAGQSAKRGTLVSLFAATMIVAALPQGASSQDQSLGIPGVQGGVVTTSEPAAARAGAEILRAGGNAVDAASAVAFALNVLEPQSSGMGGGGFMIIHMAGTSETTIIDSREQTPASGSPTMFLDSNGDAFSFSIRSTSGVGVGIPGMVRGIEKAQDMHGTLSFADVLQPAIKLAEDGIRVSSRLEESIEAGVASGGRLANQPGDPAYDLARSVFAPGGAALQTNTLLVQPDLANTLKTLAMKGPSAFYKGQIAQAIIATQQNARTTNGDGTPIAEADVERLRGGMTKQDLRDYEAKLRDPIDGLYRGYRVLSMPPPSSGALTVIQVLKLIQGFPIGDESQGFGFGSQRTLNVMMEAMRLAFADRALWMGDDDFVDVPSVGLLNDAYIDIRRALIDPDARQGNVLPDDPRPFDVTMAAPKVQLAKLQELDAEGLNTTHFSVVDKDGNAVSYTNTVESAWGTGLMVPGYGFLLNNELTDFNRVPAFNNDPANFNPGANDAAAGKRPRSSMSPSMVFKNGNFVAAYGSPGGSTIINSVINTTLNLIDHEMTVQEAVDAPRISQTSANGSPTWEAGFDQAVIDALIGLGHNLADSRLREIGSVQAVVVDQESQLQYGASDRRRIGGIVSLRAE